MTPKQFYASKSREEIKAIAKLAGTTFSNFQQIALCGGSVSPRLAARLADSSGQEMTEIEILYPERFGDTA